MTLDELPYWRGGTLENIHFRRLCRSEVRRWAFEKSGDAEDRLGTQMRAVGEVF